MAQAFRVEPLGATHDRSGFSCGVDVLDRHLRERATQDIKRRVSTCFVVCDATVTTRPTTCAAASFPLSDLPPEVAKRLPRCALLPAGLIGRLAVDQRFRGQRLGSALVIDAARRADADPAVFALVVDVKDAAAAAFYEHLGFRRFVNRQMSLFLPIAPVMKAVQAAEAKPRFPVIRGSASTDMSTDVIMALRRERRRK